MPSPYTPPAIAPHDIIRVTYLMTLDQQRLLTVLTGQVTASSAPDYITGITNLAQDLANDAIGATGWGAIRHRQSVQIGYDSVRVQRIAPSRDIYQEALIGQAGSDAGDSGPPNIAASFNKRTARPGRHGHGDIHLPGLPQASQTGGMWNSVLIDGITAQLSLYLTSTFSGTLSSIDLKWCLYDPTIGTGGYDNIVGVTGAYPVKTMHRRTVGLGI